MTTLCRLRAVSDGCCLVSRDNDSAAAPVALNDLPDLAQIQADPIGHGRTLYEALGGDALRAALEADDRVLLLEIDDDCMYVPWEFARAPDGRALAADYAIVRVLARPMPQSASGQLRLIALSADPLANDVGQAYKHYRQRLDSELQGLREGLRDIDSAIEVRQIPPVREQLSEAMLKGPLLLHLSCTGDISADQQGRRGVILHLEDQHGAVDLLAGDELVRSAPPGVLRLAVLSACHTSQGQGSGNLAYALVAAGVPAAIGMQGPFPEAKSARFTRMLYQALLRGHTLAEALRQARQMLDNELAGLPVLYATAEFSSSDLAHQGWGPLTLKPGTPDLRRLTDWLPPLVLPPEIQSPATGLLGRAADLHGLAQMLSDHQVVMVVGAGGMGKTALVAAFVQRFAWRWFGGVFGVSFAAGLGSADWVRRLLLGAIAGESITRELTAEAAHIIELKEAHSKRLKLLENHRAIMGLDTPPQILIGIESARTEIARLEAHDFAGTTAAQLEAQLLKEVRARKPLLVFDNYGRVLHALEAEDEAKDEARAIHRLVGALKAAGAQILLVSRIAQAKLGEAQYPAGKSLTGLDTSAAVELFMRQSSRAKESARAAQHHNVATQVAKATEGHPLAIDLLAGEYDTSRTVSPEQFLAEWPAELAVAKREALETHHASFHAAFDRTYCTLSAEQQTRLLNLSLFIVPFFAEAAALVWGGTTSEADVRAAAGTLELFVRRSLLEVERTVVESDRPAIYRLHPVIAQELARRAVDTIDLREGRTRAIAYYTWFIERAEAAVDHDPTLAQMIPSCLDTLIQVVDELPPDQVHCYCGALGRVLSRYGHSDDASRLLAFAEAHHDHE